MEEGGRTGSGLRVARQCRSAQAGDVADLTRAGESGDQAVLLGSSCRSRSHGWIPMAADGSVDRRRRFFACRIHPQAGSAGIPCARPSLPKFFAFGRVPRGARPLPASRGFGSVSSFRPLRTSQPGASPRTCWFKPTGQGARFASGFGCLPSTPLSPVK
jgi:hypothetical protein